MIINEVLDQLGLSNGEIQVYTCLLQNGPLSPTDIARKTALKRPNIYDVVKDLEKNGLVYYQLINKKKLIAASDPPKIAEMVKQKLDLAQSIIPLLKAINKEGSFQSRITFYQGKKAVQNLFNEALNMQGKELLGLWAAKDMDKILEKKVVEAFIKQRLKKGIRLKTLHPIDKESFYDNEVKTDLGRRLTEMAYLPEQYTFSLSMQIYDNKVAFYSTRKEGYGFMVESREFSEVIRMLYDLAWNNSGKLNPQAMNNG